ncbi:MAG TPA: hypothetical protein VNX65_04420 [Patescibacteria group bacterium]|nr:hypothetical protein [Patescibacteria group bacterium]
MVFRILFDFNLPVSRFVVNTLIGEREFTFRAKSSTRWLRLSPVLRELEFVFGLPTK